MTLHLMSLYDHKARAFLAPIFFPTPEVALRSILAAAMDPGTTICKHAEDFEVYELGSFDDSSGEVTPRKIPFSHGRVSVMKAVNQRDAGPIDAINGAT